MFVATQKKKLIDNLWYKKWLLNLWVIREARPWLLGLKHKHLFHGYKVSSGVCVEHCSRKNWDIKTSRMALLSYRAERLQRSRNGTISVLFQDFLLINFSDGLWEGNKLCRILKWKCFVTPLLHFFQVVLWGFLLGYVIPRCNFHETECCCLHTLVGFFKLLFL